MMRRVLVSLATGALGLIGAGCGDDGVQSSGTSSGGGGSTSSASASTTDEVTTGGGMATAGSGEGSTSVADGTTEDSGSSSGPGPAECGNGVIEDGEDCDDTEVGGQTCITQGFDTGDLLCNDDCTFDTTLCRNFMCGDNLAEGREECDGPDLGANTCESAGFDSGLLACNMKCQLDLGGCGTCGNVVVDGAEVCDDIVLLGETCESQGFDSGQLGCSADCQTYDTSGCGTCGNDLIDGAETCDMAQLGGEDCLSQGFDSGTLACDAGCVFDTAGCGLCGNGVRDGDELCDGIDVAPETCESQGFDSGQLLCDDAAGCAGYDTSGCGICGNGMIDGFEVCDDGNMIDDDGCPNDCGGTDKIVFVTSQMFTGDMGGLTGADAECQALANAAGLPGIYLAWLSDAVDSPVTRMTPSMNPYVRVDGVQVAPDWAGLIDGTLDAPINVTELGGPVPIGNTSCAGGGFPTVWSSTNSNGTSLGDACGNFASIVGSGRWGRADETGGSWSSWCFGGSCDWVSPIYCVQQ